MSSRFNTCRPSTVEEAERLQHELAAQVVIAGEPVAQPTMVAGLDVSYAIESDLLVAAAVVVEIATGRVVEEAVADGNAEFPYVPGLLAFREVPVLLDALAQLSTNPELLLCDGQGLAHPRRCGVACHLGVLTGLPAIGCAKTRFVGEHAEPGPYRGDRVDLVDSGELVGHVVRTQDHVRPVYVSPGHRVSIEQASDLVVQLSPHFRLPDPIRRADHISRQTLKS